MENMLNSIFFLYEKNFYFVFFYVIINVIIGDFSMKRIIRFLIVLLFMVPVVLSASTYDTEVGNANQLLNKENYVHTYDKYIVHGTDIKFEFSNGTNKVNSSFTNGGFISMDEFNLTQRRGSSYLFEGVEFWTLSKDGENVYAITYNDMNTAKSKLSNFNGRVTEFVNPNVTVHGEGKLNNPWTFDAIYRVSAKTDNRYATIESGNNAYVKGGCTTNECTAQIKITPKTGYRYIANDCDGLYDETTKIFSVNNVKRDTVCNVTFGKGIFVVTLEGATPSKIYLKHGENYYKDFRLNEIIRKLDSVQEKTGYKFIGYYYNNQKVINGNHEGNSDDNRKILYESVTGKYITSDVTLPRSWEAKEYKVEFNCNSGVGLVQTQLIKYDEQFTLTSDVCQKAGYSQVGWNTDPQGRGESWTVETKTDITWKIDDNVKLYAVWMICPKGTYSPLSSNECKPCQAGQFSANEGSTQCIDCAVGSSSTQGSYKCSPCKPSGETGENGTTTAIGQSSCNKSCNLAHVNTWKNSSWTNNSTSNICKIESCVTGYTLNSTNNVCNANTYTIEYYQGNNSTTAGNTKLTSSTHTYDESKTLSAYSGTAPSGWTFYGWSTTQDGTTRTYSNNQSVINLASSSGAVVKLYAVFYRTINVYSGVSKAKNNSQTQYYNPYKTDKITSVTLATPETISNWTTLGYRTDTTASTSTQAAGSITPAYNGVNSYYAVYKRTLTISYNGNTNTGGSTSNTTATIYLNTNSTTTSSQEVTLRANGYTKTNNTFYKWAAGSTSGTKYSAGDKYNPSLSYNASTFGNTMYAIWLINTAIPTNSYCKSLTYNGNNQTLVNDAGTGFTWVSGTTGKAAGDSYTVTAQLSSGYIWANGTFDNKSITCSIAKANLSAPTVSINSSGKVTWGAVSNASSYQVKIDNGSWATSTSGATSIPTTTNGTYTAYVKAIGNSNFNNSSSGSDSAVISDKILLSYTKTKKKCNGTVYWDSSTNTVTEGNCSAGGTNACSSGSNVGNSYTTCTFDHWYYTTKICTYYSNTGGCDKVCNTGESSLTNNCNKTCTCNKGTYNPSTGKCTYNATAYYTGICDCWMSNDPDLHDVINCATRSSCSAACHGYTNSKGKCTFDHYQCGSSTSSSSTCSANPKSCSYPSGSYKTCYKGTWSTGSGTTTGTCSTSTPPANCTSSATYKTGCTKYVSKVAQTCKSKNVAFGATSTSTVTTKDETENNFSTCNNAHIGSTHISYTNNYGCGSGTNAIGDKCINK